jgi:hypothetical protein
MVASALRSSSTPISAPGLGHGVRLVQDAAEHLPPGHRDPAFDGKLLGDLHEPAVEPERRKDDLGQHRAGLGLRGRLGLS